MPGFTVKPKYHFGFLALALIAIPSNTLVACVPADIAVQRGTGAVIHRWAFCGTALIHMQDPVTGSCMQILCGVYVYVTPAIGLPPGTAGPEVSRFLMYSVPATEMFGAVPEAVEDAAYAMLMQLNRNRTVKIWDSFMSLPPNAD